MGTSYYLHCLDCHETERPNSVYDPIREDGIREIIKHAPQLADLGADFDGNVELVGAVFAPLKWLAAHKGHRLRPVTSGGEIDGQCGKETKCGHCGSHTGYCGRDVDHVGDCSKEAG
jgi:hypothetical protein